MHDTPAPSVATSLAHANDALRALQPRRSWSDSRAMGFRDAVNQATDSVSAGASSLPLDADPRVVRTALRATAASLRNAEIWSEDTAYIRGWNDGRDAAVRAVLGVANSLGAAQT